MFRLPCGYILHNQFTKIQLLVSGAVISWYCCHVSVLFRSFSANQIGVSAAGGGAITEDSQRTAYQPQLRILKRQTGSETQTSGNSTDANAKVQ